MSPFNYQLTKADVEVMKERIANGANLLESHVFQFDFLNDDLQSEKVPESLRKILADENERKKLVIYINPPYAEADRRLGSGRRCVAETGLHQKYDGFMGYAKRELYIQFLTRVYNEIHGSKLYFFSKLKNLQATKFNIFRDNFKAKLEKIFLVPADTFDNVKGQFPISFQLWNTDERDDFKGIDADIYNKDGTVEGKKFLCNYDGLKVINDWTLEFIEDKKITKENFSLGTLLAVANDFQHNNTVNISNPHKPWNHQYQWQITKNNLIQSCIYFCARLIPEATWLNDRDQFLYPKDTWRTDYEFQADCLAYTLFHGQNRISVIDNGKLKIDSSNNCQLSTINSQLINWCPFTESELNATDTFDSHFMNDFINGKLRIENGECDLFTSSNVAPIINSQLSIINLLSPAAKNILASARELYRYYHAKISELSTVNSQLLLNASFYDIRAYFQGKDANGRMNNTSDDAHYNELISDLRAKQKVLAKKIEAKVYEHGFLR